MNALSSKRVSTLFLKTVLLIIALIVLALCVFLFPQLYFEMREWPVSPVLIYTALIGVYLSALPFYYALFQAFKLLNYIDRNNAFSELSITALRNITMSAIAMSVCYAVCLPMVFVFAELDDAPGVVVIGTAFACAPLVVATFAAVLQKLVRNAVDLEEENSLTI